MVRILFISLVLFFAVFGLAACKPAARSSKTSPASVESTNAKTFQVKGVVIAVKPKEKSIEIKHEAIPGYMAAMTMPFDVKDVKELSGLNAGDIVSFRMIVTDIDGWIDQIRKLGTSTNVTGSSTNSSPVRILRDVEPLNVGDPLPEYHFTNQFNQPISTAQFKGKALAITFLFTRCPFPTFCPLMANHFTEAQETLLKKSNGPANWQLLTISFDPEFDTPAVLKGYAEQHNYNPAHSTFATGDLTEINTLGEQVGLSFWRDGSGTISHNLRTLIIGADGTLRKILVGNQWSSDELVDEMLKAAKL